MGYQLGERLPQGRDRLRLGQAALAISPLCIGMTTSWRTIPAAFDAGINCFFFSADMHWPLYEPTRKGLAEVLQRGPSVRDEIVVFVVSYCAQPEFCRLPFTEALTAVDGLGRIDVMLAGGAYGRDIKLRMPPYYEHRRNKFLGVSAVGATFHDRRAAREAVEERETDIVFVRYSARHPGARTDLFPHIATRSPILVFNFKSTQGHIAPARLAELGLPETYWRPKITDHYRFVLTRPEIDGLLCSPKDPREVEELIAAMEAGPLDDEEEAHIVRLSLLDRKLARLRAPGTPSAGTENQAARDANP